MTRLALFLMTSLALGVAGVPASFAGQTQTSKAKKEKKVWTNEDLEELRGKVHLSVIGQPPTEAAAGSGEQAAAADSEKPGARTERYVRAKDPKWYSEPAPAPRRAAWCWASPMFHLLPKIRSSSSKRNAAMFSGKSTRWRTKPAVTTLPPAQSASKGALQRRLPLKQNGRGCGALAPLPRPWSCPDFVRARFC
jgi:hypothetical protein